MLLPLALPVGIVKNGTPYQRRGRWTDSNLIRWYNGSIRPIGGWAQRQDVSNALIPTLVADETLEAVRDTFAWRNNIQEQNLVLGSNLKLYHVDQLGTVTDVTPVGAVTSNKDAALQAGYGQNPFGLGAYGVANNLIAQDPIPMQRWGFSNFGELLLAQQRNNGPLYEMDPSTLVVTAVTNAPSDSMDVCVTDQRLVVVVGADGDPRKVAWSDQEDRNTWTPAVANQAGDFTLTGTGRLLRCMNVLKQVVLFSEDDVHVMRYVGPPYVFSFDLAGRNCGPAAPEAVVGTERFAVWYGDRQFWLYDGSVQPLPCEVMDFFTADIDEIQISKITGFSNSQFGEVWWLYQSQSSTTTECDSYITWNYRENYWTTGRLDRTAGIDKGVLPNPIMVDNLGVMYLHELEGVEVDGTAFIESGEIDLTNGEKNMAVRYVYPDTEASGDVNFTIKARQFPTDTEYTYGPYTYNNPTPTRALGRAIKMRFEGQTAGFEIGTMRLDVAPMGTGQR